jgi:hypothetical protein
VAHHDETGEGPVVAYMAPKMNAALDKIEQYTGARLPLQQVGSAHAIIGHGQAAASGSLARTSAVGFKAAEALSPPSG